VELERKIGQKGMVVPGETATPAEVRAAMKQLGCPDEPDHYPTNIELPQGVKIDDKLLATMKQRAWDSGLSTTQWTQQFETFAGAQIAQHQAQAEAWNTHLAATTEKLKAEYGPAYEGKVEAAAAAANAIFGEEAAGIRGLPLPNGTVMGNHPLFVKALAELGEKLSEHDLIPGIPTRTTMTAEEAKRELDALNADKEHMDAYMDGNHPGHKVALQKRDTLYRYIHPGEQTGATGSAAGNMVG